MATAANNYYGSDTYCLTDVQLIDTQVTDPRVLISQRLVRRLTTPYGALAIINDVADDGFDVRTLINAKITSAGVIAAQNRIQSECLKDEQVHACTVDLAFNDLSNSAAITITVTAQIGIFLLTLNVSELTVELVFSP